MIVDILLWIFAASILVAGMAAASIFVRILVRRPASLERFKMLCNLGTGAVLLMSCGTCSVLNALPLGFGVPIGDYAAKVVFGFVVLGGLFLTAVNFAVPSRNSRTQEHDDFVQDAEGNATRSPDEPE